VPRMRRSCAGERFFILVLACLCIASAWGLVACQAQPPHPAPTFAERDAIDAAGDDHELGAATGPIICPPGYAPIGGVL